MKKHLLPIIIFIVITTSLCRAQTWSLAGSGVNNQVNALDTLNGSLYVGGKFDSAGQIPASHIAVWNALNWDSVGSGLNGVVNTLVNYNGNLIAAGEFTGGGGTLANNIAEWNGTNWIALGTGLNNEVFALAVYNGNLYAGGIFDTAGGTPVNNIAKWNGTTWTALGTGVSGSVHGLAVYNGNLCVGGAFGNAGGIAVNNVAQWDDTSWSAIGVGVNGEIDVMDIYSGELYAGGNFSATSIMEAFCTVQWGGSLWYSLGSGTQSSTNPGVYSIGVSNNNIYFGGFFQHQGGIPALNVAQWHGATWTRLGSGINNSVFALAAYDGNLYAAGAFDTAGGVAVNNIAQWGTAIVVTPDTSTICLGNSDTLKAIGATTYTWIPATGLSASTGDSVTANPTVTTTYTVIGIINGYTYTTTVIVNVLSTPTIILNAPSPMCSGESVKLIATGATSYTWTPSTGLNATTGSSVTANPTVTTTYTVTGANGNGCTNTTTLVVTVNPLPIISANSDTICDGSSATLTATGATTYTWSPSTGLNATTGSSVTANPTVTTTYTVTGANGNGCTNTTTSVVTVNPLPIISANSDTICDGSSATLTATGATTYTWSPSTGLNATTGSSVTDSPTLTTTYTITGTNGSGCANTTTSVVTVNPLPILNANSATICDGSSATLSASGAISYTWSPATGLSATTGDSVIANPTVTTIYTVSGTDSTGCSAVGSDNVTVDSCGVYVWPGDANDDLVVNNYDLIPIGLYYGETGPARDSVTNEWAGQRATNWDSLQSDGYNRKFVNCNGDGTINSDDTLAITLNYGDTHLYHSPRSASEERSGGVPLYFIADSSLYHAGSRVHVAVWLGNSTTQATNIYGLGYDIALDTSLIQTGTLAFNYNNSFIGSKNTNVLSLTHISSNVETAIVGYNHINKNGYGKIGDLYFTLAGNSTPQMTLSFSNYEAVDANGNQLTLSLGSDTMNIATGIRQLSINSDQLSIFPNPTSGQFTIKLNSNQNGYTVEVYNVMGEMVYQSVSINSQEIIDLHSQPAGMYFVYLKSKQGVEVGKVIVSK